MKKRTRILLCFCIALAGVVAVVVLAPVARKINTTLPVTEYRFDDSDYAVEHTITIQGHDTRNLLGHGRFEGYFTVDGQPIHPDGGHFRVQFPPPDIYWNVSDIHPPATSEPTPVFSPSCRTGSGPGASFCWRTSRRMDPGPLPSLIQKTPPSGSADPRTVTLPWPKCQN